MRRICLTLLSLLVLTPVAARATSAEATVWYFYEDRTGTCIKQCTLLPICCPCRIEIPFPLIL